MTESMIAPLRLHQYLARRHWNGKGLVGPDPGIRINYRIGRFVKSYLPNVRWKDDYYYLQAQGYWIIGNWNLYELTGDTQYREIAVAAARNIIQRQREDGAWEYPNPEWSGRIATNEGTWAALALLETYRHTDDAECLQGVRKWLAFLINVTGFQRHGDELAVNYFANRGQSRVPNNSITVLRLFAEWMEVTGERELSETCEGMITFLTRVQLPTGEFPYCVAPSSSAHETTHFQCYQYNAFECLNLIRYYQSTNDERVLSMTQRQINFLKQGLAPEGYAYYECGGRRRNVTYHSAVLGAAMTAASRIQIANGQPQAQRAFDYVLNRQASNGGFAHSFNDYGVLCDRRSYPRYLAMILCHLLYLPGIPSAPATDTQTARV